jgi:hypothetical protein
MSRLILILVSKHMFRSMSRQIPIVTLKDPHKKKKTGV